MDVTGRTKSMFFFLVLPISPRYSEVLLLIFLFAPISLWHSEVPMLTILLLREDLIGWVRVDFGSREALGCFAQGVVKEPHRYY